MQRCQMKPNRKARARLLQGGVSILGSSEKQFRDRLQTARIVGRAAPRKRPREEGALMKLALHLIAPIAALGLIALCLLSQAPVLERIR